MINFLSHIASIYLLNGGQLMMDFFFNEIVQPKVLCCFVESLEEFHDVSQSYVYFQLVHKSNDFDGLNFAVDVEENVWSVQ